LVEDGEVGAVGDDAAGREPEDAAFGAGAEFLDVVAEQSDEFGVDGDGTGFAFCAVLEGGALADAAVVGPVGAAAGWALVSRNSPQPLSGRLTMLVSKRSMVSSGRSAA
jgi:hypothetical protein